jgi:Protein of unknown function (DUF2934)
MPDIKGARNPSVQPESNSSEEIQRRAYQLYLQRGGQEGYALDDWLKAENELRGQFHQSPAPTASTRVA